MIGSQARTRVEPARSAPVATIRTNLFQRYAGRMVLYVLVVTLAILYAMPFLWMLSTSVKPGYQIYVVPPVWWPDTFNWSNFVNPWFNLPFARFYYNTLVVTVTSIIGTLLSSSLVAFAFAR